MCLIELAGRLKISEESFEYSTHERKTRINEIISVLYELYLDLFTYTSYQLYDNYEELIILNKILYIPVQKDLQLVNLSSCINFELRINQTSRTIFPGKWHTLMRWE